MKRRLRRTFNSLRMCPIAICFIAVLALPLMRPLSVSAQQKQNSSVKQVWSFQTSDAVWQSPAVRDGMLYVSDNDGNLYAVDVETGEQEWRTSLDRTKGPPVVTEKYVIVSRSTIHAVNRESGKTTWTTSLDSPTRIALDDDRLYAASENGKVRALSPSSGDVQWSRDALDGEIRMPPAVKSGRLYVAAGSTIYCLNPADGTTKWTMPAKGDRVETPLSITGNHVTWGTADYHSAKPGSKNVRWTLSTKQHTSDRPPASYGNRVFLQTGYSGGNQLLCMNANTGDQIWSRTGDEEDNFKFGPILYGNRLYVLSDGMRTKPAVLGLNPNNGDRFWKKSLSTDSISTKLVAADGRLFVTTQPGNFEPSRIRCFKLSTSSGPGWMTAGGNVGRTYSASPGDDANSLTEADPEQTDDGDSREKWVFSPGGTIWSSPSATPDGSVVFTALDGKLYSINEAGKQNWAVDLGSQSYSSATVAPDGTVYAGAGSTVYAFNSEGSRKWAQTVDGGTARMSPALGTDGTLYVPTGKGIVKAFAPDGSVRWSTDVDLGTRTTEDGETIDDIFDLGSAIIGRNGRIYVSSYDGDLFVLSPDDGSVLLETSLNSRGTQKTFSMDRNNHLYLYSNRYTFGFDPPQVTRQDSYLNMRTVTPPVIGPEGHLYTGGVNGVLRKFRPDGTQVWEKDMGEEFTSHLCVGSNGVVYATVGSYNLYGVLPNGDTKWKKRINGAPKETRVFLDDEGTLYVPASGELRAYDTDADGPADSAYPMTRAHPRGTSRVQQTE